MVLDRLAGAYASLDRFDLAARYEQEAFESALGSGNRPLAQRLREQLEEYQRQRK